MKGLKFNSDYRILYKGSCVKNGTVFFNQRKGEGMTKHPGHLFTPWILHWNHLQKKNCKPRLKNKLKHDEIIVRSPTPEKQYFWKISRIEEQIMEPEISLLKSIITTWILHIASLLMDDEYFFKFGSLPLR